MRAAVLRVFGRPLELEERPAPVSEDGEVLVRVRAVGLCGTDLKIADGLLEGTPLPLVLGHEIAGEVVEGGEDLEAGERVALYFYDPCGECSHCRAGDESLCRRSQRLGFERDGGLAQLVRVRRRNVLRMGDAMPFDAAAVAMDAVLTPWHALHTRGHVQAGETVVIAGAGGLGLSAVQIARAAGAQVAVVDPAPDHLARAESLGAQLTVDLHHTGELADWSGGGADLALEMSGTRSGFEAAAASVRSGGRVVCCGYRPGMEHSLHSPRLVLDEISILGSRAGSREEARAALAAVARGAVRPVIAARLGLEQANEALERLRSGGICGRVVIEIAH